MMSVVILNNLILLFASQSLQIVYILSSVERKKLFAFYLEFIS